MTTRTIVWSVICCGVVWALLAAGLAVQAEDFPGDGVTGPALSYRRQSDGTVRDNNTLLIWEVKNGGSGIHGVNRTFFWAAPGGDPNGTIFTVFLATLNNKCDGDEATPCMKNPDCLGIGNGKCGYAGHRDWRLPNVKELQSLVDYGASAPPAIDATFPGATTAVNNWTPSLSSTNYWSSTPFVVDPAVAWTVSFSRGDLIVLGKWNDGRVRAVRGGP